MPRNDGKVIKLKLCQEDYIKLKGESLIRGRTMAHILREALDLYFGEYGVRISYQKVREMGKERELPIIERRPERYPFNPADNIQVTVYGCPGWDVPTYTGTAADRIVYDEFMRQGGTDGNSK